MRSRYSIFALLITTAVVLLGFSGVIYAKTELVYWIHGYEPAVVANKEIIQQFEALYPDVNIRFDYVPHDDFETKLFTAFAAGVGPDVYWIADNVFPQMLESDMVDAVMPSAFGVDSQAEFETLFEPGALEAFKVDGTLYTAGISEYNTLSVYYDKAAFREAGLPYPSATEPMTVAEFIELGQKLTKIEKNRRIRSGIEFEWRLPNWISQTVEPWVRQLGGELVDPETGMPQFDSEEVITVVQLLQDLVFKYETSDPAFVLQDHVEDFAYGRVAMVLGGPFHMGFTRGLKPDMEIGVMPFPVFEGSPRVTTKYSWAWMVNPHSRNRELAWKFAAFAATEHQGLWWNNVRFIQPLKGKMDQLIEAEPLMETFVADFEYSKYQFSSTQYYELAHILLQAVSEVTSAPVDVRQVMERAQKEALGAVGL
ncbi:MAG: extracellular solute-binding protein [Firmicutes bacterium]|nr:extracellular solute-binding protein [Bacillota bacterium]